MSSIYRKPWVGLLGLALGFLTQPLGHTVYKLMEQGFGAQVYPAAVAVGILGFAIVWRGLKRPELPATLAGLVGGWFIWIGWFEYSFKFFAELYSVQGFAVEPTVERGYVAAPQANMLQATVTIMLALLLLYGIFNLQTKCNFMRFFHRNLRFSPGMPTPDNHRSFARITAMEVLFVTWFCYQFWLYVIYFGTRGPGAQAVMALYLAWTAWALYLVWKCTQQVRMAAALRYGVGAGIVLWGSAEMPAHFGAYREYWLHPAEYPVFNLVCTAVFVAGLVVAARRPVGRSDAGSSPAALSLLLHPATVDGSLVSSKKSPWERAMSDTSDAPKPSGEGAQASSTVKPHPPPWPKNPPWWGWLTIVLQAVTLILLLVR